jgi:dynactin 4
MGEAAKDGPWFLNCNYCMWTSLDIGIKFDRPTNIRTQLDKLANGGKPRAPLKPPEITDFARRSSYLGREPYARSSVTSDEPSETYKGTLVEAPVDPASRFAALKSFYKDQLTTTTATDPSLSSISGDFSSYSSPASLARIMNLYSTSRTLQPKKKAKTPVMREALYSSEGLLVPDSSTVSILQSKILSNGFSNTTSIEQRNFQTGPGGGNPNARFVDELRPMPAPLTTKRAKRCKECRHILVKPELKPTSTRCRIRLIALGNIPHVALKPFPRTSLPALSGPSAILGGDVVLDPGRPTQWILTLRNPLFDPVRVNLATPAVTPGRCGHKVTILCPQFEVGANGDVWDEALNSKEGPPTGTKSPGGGGAAEAGKLYDKGRNWTSVVVEVVPVAFKNTNTTTIAMKPTITSEDDGKDEEGRIGEDEDALEIPVRVRLEWKQGDLDQGENKKVKLNEEAAMDDGRRELAYWMVLGVGRVKM